MENQAPQTAPITPQVSDSNPIQEPTPKKSKLIYIFWGMLVLLIVTIGASATVYISKSFKTNPPQKLLTSPSPEKTQKLNTQDWKIYNGNGFSFQYPMDWELNDNSSLSYEPSIQIRKGTIPSIMIYLQKTAMLKSQMISLTVVKKESLAIGSYSVIFNHYTTIATKDPALYSDLDNPNLPFVANIYLSKKSEANDIKSVKQILSTFKFAHTTNAENWKTARISFAEFKYPSEWGHICDLGNNGYIIGNFGNENLDRPDKISKCDGMDGIHPFTISISKNSYDKTSDAIPKPTNSPDSSTSEIISEVKELTVDGKQAVSWRKDVIGKPGQEDVFGVGSYFEVFILPNNLIFAEYKGRENVLKLLSTFKFKN